MKAKKIFTKIISLIHSQTFIKYIFSYFLVLIIPMTAFFMVYNRYFVDVYRNEVLIRGENQLERLDMQVSNYIYQMQSIANQFSHQKALKSDSLIEQAPSYSNVINTLSSVTSAQFFFSDISFYSTATPNTVYTNNGTYNVDFFKQYVNDAGKTESIVSLFKNYSFSGGWYLPQQIVCKNSIGSAVLDYIVPIPGSKNNFIIFSIPENSFNSIIEINSSITAIFNNSNKCIYPFSRLQSGDMKLISEFAKPDSTVKLDNGNYLISKISARTGLSFVQLVPQNIILQDVKKLQNTFLIILFVLIAVCGVVVYILAFMNYRPIKRLFEQANDKIRDIPDGLCDTEVVSYAIEHINHQYVEEKIKAQKEKLLLKLIYGKFTDQGTFDMESDKAGIAFQSFQYRVILVYAAFKQKSDIQTILESHLKQHFEIKGIEHIENNCYLFILGYQNYSKNSLEQLLTKFCNELSQKLDSNISVAVGGVSKKVFEIFNSYRQAIGLPQESGNSTVRFYEDYKVILPTYVYPKIDIETLHYAIVNANVDKVSLITDMLVKTVESSNENLFFALSICYDIINTSLMAMEELYAQINSNKYNFISDFKIYEYSDIASLVRIIYEIRDEIVKIIGSKYNNTDSTNVIAKIIGYVKEHYYDEDVCVSQLSEMFGMTISNLSHQFKEQTGFNISDYIRGMKMEYAKRLLRETNLPISEVSIRVGYIQSTSFFRIFKKYEELTPTEYRIAYNKHN